VKSKHLMTASRPALSMTAGARYGGLERKEDNGGGNGGGDAPADTAEIKELVGQFLKTFDTFEKKNDERLKALEGKGQRNAGPSDAADPLQNEELKRINGEMDKLQKTIDDLRLGMKRPELEGDGGRKRAARTEDEVKHAGAFNRYFRKGDDNGLAELEEKALSVGSQPDGGYMVPVEMSDTITRVLSEVSPIRSIATVRTISSASFKQPVNIGGAGAGWVGEQSARPATATPNIKELEFPVMELYANPLATQNLLDDSAVDIEAWLADEVQITFAEMEGAAFVAGDGVNKPRGFLSYATVANSGYNAVTNWGKLGHVLTGGASGFAASDPHEALIDLVYGLKAGYRQNARFVMNRFTQGEVRKMKDGDGNLIWQPGLQNGQPASLLGYAITEAEDMPDVTEAGGLSMAFGDFARGYLIVDRQGVRVLRDPYSAKPYVQFYTTKRVGGGVRMFDAIKVLKTAAA
jgi:HK97 family phage major capsid protein